MPAPDVVVINTLSRHTSYPVSVPEPIELGVVHAKSITKGLGSGLFITLVNDVGGSGGLPTKAESILDGDPVPTELTALTR